MNKKEAKKKEGQAAYDNQMMVNMATKEQPVSTSLEPPSKVPRGFHHP